MEKEVMIRIIELANEWSSMQQVLTSNKVTVKGFIEGKAELFDQAYKAIVKTVTVK